MIVGNVASWSPRVGFLLDSSGCASKTTNLNYVPNYRLILSASSELVQNVMEKLEGD
jgi:hypothetical protein